MSRLEEQLENQMAAALEKLTAKSEQIIHRYKSKNHAGFPEHRRSDSFAVKIPNYFVG